MLIRDFLRSIERVLYIAESPEYIYHSSRVLAGFTGNPDPVYTLAPQSGPGELIVLSRDQMKGQDIEFSGDEPERYIWMMLTPDGPGMIICSHSHYLFSFCRNLVDNCMDIDIAGFEKGKFISPSFHWHRTAYDYYLTQEGRICRGLDRESYIRELAKNGFTHLEVNGLAYPMGLEDGPKGETYPMFYTYCPALDQFVYSELNKGLYPYYYLEANLRYLKENARLAIKYGMVPGMLCFEPRTVPEKFFEKYPMLRGARVDHPFRSFKPRYNMTITHPRVREHYAEMVGKLMKEVPELGFLNIWTNDSGAGFEHTKSLYVGRNGGAYLIREWKDDGEIARLAGDNALRFLRTLRDAGREVNPDFRVITRLESFYGEHEIITDGLGDKLDIETSSLVQRGWEMPYHHPKYKDQFDINGGSVYQRDFYPEEMDHINKLKKKGSSTSLYFGYGPQVMFAPLLGIPYPWLTHQRLKQLCDNGVESLSHMGGSVPPELAPYNVNHNLLNAFQYDCNMDPDEFIRSYAMKHAGNENAEVLISAWKLTEEAILGFPNVSNLYSTIGFSWYRLWVRPLVPNIEAIPQEERDYYENFMCTTPHNPNNVDLSKDVLFQLSTAEKSKVLVKRIDKSVWSKLDKAIKILGESSEGILYDQRIRLQALRCWIMTQRNIASWIELVYGYMNSRGIEKRKKIKLKLKDTIQKEIVNTEVLLNLLDSGVEFMAVTDKGETPLVYGNNMDELLIKRLVLMSKHIEDEPFIDHEYTQRKAGEPIL